MGPTSVCVVTMRTFDSSKKFKSSSGWPSFFEKKIPMQLYILKITPMECNEQK